MHCNDFIKVKHNVKLNRVLKWAITFIKWRQQQMNKNPNVQQIFASQK